MYVLRTPEVGKFDLEKKWRLSDRVFFACGACNILAFVFLEKFGTHATKAEWVKPSPGFRGNHIFVSAGGRAFDYHGYSERERLLAHYFKRARRWHPGWDATLVEVPAECLISEEKSRMIEGLWLRGPDQFFRNALPRARAYLDKFSAPTP